MKNTLFLASIAWALLAVSCKKDDNGGNNSGSVQIHFSHVVGAESLVLNSKEYRNGIGQAYTVSAFNYYISNIVLNGEGDAYTEPESYHLIKEQNAGSKMFTLKDVPKGKYTSITFTIGVDSLRNVSGAQTGALDPSEGMFWSWNTGYIMATLGGKVIDGDKELTYHIGGFQGEYNVLKTVTFSFSSPLELNNNEIHLQFKADVARWMYGAHDIDLSILNTVHMPGENAKKIADNYAAMFTLEHADIH